ncbi:hypothetical protein BGZ60DRAFT_558833 [Tricladium varicosporioides]|nr:hypothetical protein BGZ60DRAFT_558833 [Hymenoscyphus varicosporioides]
MDQAARMVEPHNFSSINESTFMGCIWVFTCMSFIFVCFRIFNRLRAFKRLWSDDILICVAWSMIFASSILWQKTYKALYSLSSLTYLINSSSDPRSVLRRGLGLDNGMMLAIQVLYYCALLVVKLSLLVFFRRLVCAVEIGYLKVSWWVVLIMTVGAWAASLADVPFCGLLGSLQYDSHCMIWLDRPIYPSLIANAVMDVMTDLLILAIPIALLWRVRIQMRRKLALVGIFGLMVMTMAIAIIRVAVLDVTMDQPRLFFWTAIEPPVGKNAIEPRLKTVY